MILEENLETIITMALLGGVYAMLWFSMTYIDPSKPTKPINYYKLAATMMIGAGVGIASIFMQIDLTMDYIAAYLLGAGATIAIVELILSTLWNIIMVYVLKHEPVYVVPVPAME